MKTQNIKKFLSVTLAVTLLVTLLSGSVITVRAEDNPLVTFNVSGTYSYENAEKVLEIVNAERAKENIAPLTMDESLLDSAMLRSAESLFYYSHTRPDGTICFTVNSKARAENIALNQKTPEKAMVSWMASEGHRNNIMNPEYTTIGIGCFLQENRYMWVQLFGKGTATSSTKNGTENVTPAITSLSSLINPYFYLSTPNTLKVGDTITNDSFGLINQGHPRIYCDVTNSSVVFTSNNDSVVSIDENNLITVTGAGDATITMSLKGYPAQSATYNITLSDSVYEPLIKKGDINFDNDIDLTDIVLAQKKVALLIDFDDDEFFAADVNSDTSIDMQDVVLIQKHVAQIINKF